MAQAETIEFDVLAAIEGDNIYSFGITNSSTSGVSFCSKVGAAILPELIIEILLTQSRNTTGESNGVPGLPEYIAFNPIFPNPSNFETTLKYTLPTHATVRLTVYNLSGQVVLQRSLRERNIKRLVGW